MDKKKQQQKLGATVSNDYKKWYEEFEKYNISNEHQLDAKDTQIQDLINYSRTSFESAEPAFIKNNPSDSKWLQIALHKGTSKDRANAGALLVQSNPMGNLKSLETLIGLTKPSNKSNIETIHTITQLFINGILPPYRKLFSVRMRMGSWIALKKQTTLNDQNRKNEILASWHFEAQLKELYFEFLKNLQAVIQSTQDSNKNEAIVCAAQLLIYAPEKEQMLLAMLVNKLGDPSSCVAAKALYHLTQVAYKHPAMCTVITEETAKLLFRNNITEHAQHFALCFLGQIASQSNINICGRLVDICCSFFKKTVQNGAVNSKIMRSILRCLKHSMIQHNDGNDMADDLYGYLSKDIQDTMYRLIHLADIHVALQTFALLLQIVSIISSASLSTGRERYYNALYKKILDIKLTTIGPKPASHFFHIVHRSIHLDGNVPRAQAFIKRLLQIALTLPAQMACGCLIVINKLFLSRPELIGQQDIERNYGFEAIQNNEKNLLTDNNRKTTNVNKKYNPLHRSAEFCGAEHSYRTELLRLMQHFHPTIQIFAANIIENKNIDFYGDPLHDFSLAHFLERFSFRNPRKLLNNLPETSIVQIYKNRRSTPYGGRGVPVKSLTSENCTEDEQFIFQYLKEKRAKLIVNRRGNNESEVNDEEFEAYIDQLGGGTGNKDTKDSDSWNNEFKENFIKDTKSQKKRNNNNETEKGAAENWSDEDVNFSEDDKNMNNDMDDNDTDGSISFDDDDRNDVSSDFIESDDNDNEPKSKQFETYNGKYFKKTLKRTTDMNSLFAAVDDFADLLDDAGKSKITGAGTLGDICNKDKSSEKQLQWEAKRLKFDGRKLSRKPYISGEKIIKIKNKKEN